MKRSTSGDCNDRIYWQKKKSSNKKQRERQTERDGDKRRLGSYVKLLGLLWIYS